MPQYDDTFFIDSERGGGKSRTYKVSRSIATNAARTAERFAAKEKFKRKKSVVASVKYATSIAEIFSQVESASPQRFAYQSIDANHSSSGSGSSEFLFIFGVCGVCVCVDCRGFCCFLSASALLLQWSSRNLFFLHSIFTFK